MKDKIQSYVGMRLGGCRLIDTLTTHLSPTNHPLKHGIGKYIFSFLLVLAMSIGQMWAADPTYDNPSRSTYAEKTFLNVAGTQPNVTGTDNYLCYGTLYMANTVTGDKFFARLSGSGGTSSSSYTYATPATGFLAASSTSATNTYGSINANRDRPWGLYFTGATQVSVLKKDNNTSSNKWVILKLYTVAADGTETLVETKEESSPDKNNIKVLSCATTLSASAYYKLEITSGNTSNCAIYQVSFKQPDACSTEITTQPSGATIAKGDANPELSIVATNVASYAWKESSDGTSYDGESTLASTASFTPEVNDAVQTKYYYCEVTSDCDGTTVVKSDIVTINVVGSITYYTVTLVPAGGTIVDATGWTLNAGNYEKEVADGTVLTLPTFTKENRMFKTWRKAGPTDVASPITVTEDVTLTAVWTATIEQVIYSWEGAEGGAIETGGTASSSTNGGSSFDDAQINVPQAGYYCIQLNGKNDYSTNLVEITLSGDEKVKTGDKIKYTGFYNNADTKNAAPKMRAADGTAIFSGSNLPNITTSEPRTDTHVVPSGINTATVQLTRAQTQSSSFLANLQIIRDVQVEEGDLLTVTFDTKGGSSISPVMVASGQTIAKPADPTKEHNRFNEWQLSGSAYNFSTPVTSSITLDATWTPLYTVTYAANGGSGTMTDANEYAAGDEVTLLENTFEAPDVTKIWDSWAVTDALDNPVSVSAGKFAMPSSNATVTAQWTTISDFDVKFFQGYGDPDAQIGETQSISTGNYATAPAEDPERAGYRFLGWSYDATAEHIVNVSEYAITAATNFTAMWIQQFAVTFDGAGEVLVDNGATVASPNSPSQSGKVFAGWYNGESKYDFSAAVTEDLTLESKWTTADANHYYYNYKDDFHFDGVVYKTPEGKVDEGAGASNVAITTPYTLFSGAEGITSIVANNAIYDSKSNWVNAYLKLNTSASSNLVFTIKSGYSAVLKMKMGGYSANPTVTLVDAGDNPVAVVDGTISGVASTENNYAEITYNLVAGTYTMTTTVKTLYISHIDLEATAIPAHVVTYLPGEATGAEFVIDDDATQVLDCPVEFIAPEGKIFHGWKDALDNDVAVGTIVEADMTLTAQWINHYAVTFNLQGHGDAIDPQDIKEGAKATRPDDPVVIGWDFGGWFTDAECTAGNEFDFETPITAATPLFAKWTADPCPDKKSIVKAVMATNTTATVTGYNSNEYAGGFIINNLADDASNTNMYDFGEGEVKGFKLKGSNSAIFATLSKGGFEVGDQVVFAVTKNAGDNKLAIYAAKDKDHVLKLVELDVDAAGIYTYRLTQDNIDAIEAAGSDYLSIGTFRGDYNPYIYSVELKGCRSWAIFHTLTFKNIDGTATIAAEPLEEGAYASTVAPVAPKITLKRCLGWSESIGGSTVDLTTYTITEDKTLYAVYEDIVCPTTGTVYKFEIKDELPSENLPTSTDKDMSSYITATGDGYLTYTATANNKATINSDGTIQMKDASAAYLKVELECALAAGDQIRAHVTNNPMRVQVGTTYDSNKDLILAKNAYEFVAITSAMEGKQVLYITRSSNGNANLADFEIYRPAKFDVSFDMMGHGSAIADIEDVLEGSKIVAPTAPTDEDYSFAGWYKENTLANEWKFDVDVVEANTTLYAKWLDKSDATLKSLKYGETEIALEAGVYTYNVSLPAFTSAVPALTAETSNPSATKVIANAAAFDSEGNATSTVTVTPEVGADQVYTVNFAKGVEILLQDVTGSITWNFANAVTANVSITGTPQVLANYGGVTNDNTFESDKLEASGEKFTAGSKANLRANYIHFHTTVPGMLTISYSNTGGNPARYIYVNGAKYDEDGSANTTPKGADNKVFVPAGDVELVMKDGEDASKNVHIYQMIFNATPDYTRNVTEGRYGTICLPQAGIMVGAVIFELAYYSESDNKIFMDQVMSGEMVAGRPYVFLPNEGVSTLGVFYTSDDTEDAGNYRGLYGFYDNSGEPMQLDPGDGHYILYNNQFREVTVSHVWIDQNRAYFKIGVAGGIPTNVVAPLPGRRRMSIGAAAPQVTTGMDELNAGEAPVKVLINGELFILRGDKMFDATGRLIK